MSSCEMLTTSPSPRSQNLYSKSPSFNQHHCRHGHKQTPAPSTTTSPQLSTAISTSTTSNTRSIGVSTVDLQLSSHTASSSSQSPSERVSVGTQYSPPDWPPTSSRSSLRATSTIAHNRELNRQLPTASSYPGSEQRLAEPQPLVQKVADTQSAASGFQDNHAPFQSVPTEPPSEPDPRLQPSPTLQNAIRRPLSADSDPANSATDGNLADSAGSSASSQFKRSRHEDSSASKAPIILPNDYSLCPPKTLATIIASMLMRLIAHNDSIPLRDGHLTRFHSRAPPGISVQDYLSRLTFHATLSPPILLSMVFFIDRLSSYYPKFVINSLTVHRFLITAATVASKGLSDSFWTSPVYARVGGVSVKELALLELELLIQCHWRIVPKPQDLVEYYRGLVGQSDSYLLEEDFKDQELKRQRSNSDAEMIGVIAASPKEAHHQVKAANNPDNPEADDPMDTGG